MKNNADARTLRTRAQLKKAMLEQLKSRQLHEITVSGLCRACQINRVTFYDHYKDVFHLADAIEDDLIGELNGVFQRLAAQQADSNLVSDSMFEFLGSHRREMLLLLKGETGTSFRNKFYEAIFPFFEAQLNYRYAIPREIKREELLNIMHFVASGYDYFYLKYLEDPTLDYRAASALCTRLSTQALLSWRQGNL